MRDYTKLKIERDRPNYPRGLKHYAKDTIAENSLFDIELAKYKLKSIVKGQNNGEEDTTRCKAQSKRTAKEILRGLVFRLLYEDRPTAIGERANRAIEDRYIAIAQGEREEHEESETERKAETQAQENEDRG